MGKIRQALKLIAFRVKDHFDVQLEESLDGVGETIETELFGLHCRIKLLEQSHSLPHEHVPKPLPCDKQDERNWKRGDLLHYEGNGLEFSGIFHCVEGRDILGWWAQSGYPKQAFGYGSFPSKNVTFIIRPENQDC